MTVLRAEPEQVLRCAITLEPREPFFEWLNGLHPDLPSVAHDADIEGEAVYLLPTAETPVETLSLADEHFEYFFVSALTVHCLDFSKWPRKRTLELFKLWFTVRLRSLVLDVDPTPLRHG